MNWIKKRKTVQLASSIGIFALVSVFNLSLWVVFGISALLGVVFGKTFCKWMCPVGYMMELMTSKMSNEEMKLHMYNYYKLGCPISWIQGFMNKFSILRIKRDPALCTSCGACDKVCYIPSFDKTKSLYKPKHIAPSEAFNCSKCLECVDSCPTKSLTVGIK